MKRFGCCMLIVGLAALAAAAEQDAGLPVVVPTPRQMEWAAKAPAWISVKDLKGVSASAECEAAANAGLEQINRRLRELGLEPLAAGSAGSKGVVRLTLAKAPDAAKDSPSHAAQAYRLVVSKEDAAISASGLPGLYYGLVTLAQLIDKDGRIACVDIEDKPELAIRGTYIAGCDDWERRIPYWASIKLNLALFEAGDFYKLSDPALRKRWEDIFALCRKHFIEPVPELQSLGWGNQVLELLPEAAEGLSIDDRPLPVKNGRITAPDTPPAPDAALLNAGFDAGEGNDLAGWSQDPPGTCAFIDTESPHEGKGCLRITTEPRDMLRVWQDVECAPDGAYELGGFVKDKDVVKGDAYIEVYGLQADGNTLGEWLGRCDAIPRSDSWQRTALRFEAKGCTRLRVFARIQEGGGTAYFDELAVKGIRKPDSLFNVIVTEKAPVTVKDSAGTVTYVQDADYRLELPSIRYPYASDEALVLALTPNSRIKDGDTVRVSYTYAPFGSISCCASEPRYQQFMRESLHETIELLHPKYVCIGHDEPRAINRDKRCTERGLTSAEVFADDIKRMRDDVREASPETRLIIYGDALSPYHKTESYARLTDAAHLIPRDVIVAMWWYDEKESENTIDKGVPYFLNLGYDITGSPWFTRSVAYRWAKVLSEHGRTNPHVLGEIYTSWACPTHDPWDALVTTAQYSWNIDQPATPDVAMKK